ncbi:MBL fold metallo-hydrolase [bacterium]|nr:MBL fold metallo-hydrolase [candidate division CSSED10-310 bacterium]
MIFKHVLLDINDSNSYIIACEKTRHTLLIDPGEYHRDIANFIRDNQLDLKFILITHAHYDHASGLEDVLRAFGGKVLVNQPDFFSRAQRVIEGDRIRIGSIEATVLHTPGHTPDSISLRLGNSVFTGDTLFCGSVGKTHDRKKHEELLFHIHRAILSLGDHTLIYPGHGPATTVGIEKTFNPYLI